MQCIFFGEHDICYARPVEVQGSYKPEPEVQNKFCKTDKFRECPRLAAYVECRP